MTPTAMTATLTEAEVVFKHRMEMFIELNFTVAQAEVLADDRQVDWHYAKEKLIDQGCDPMVAFRILHS